MVYHPYLQNKDTEDREELTFLRVQLYGMGRNGDSTYFIRIRGLGAMTSL
jgi:hypothetical protein